ncbi:MAG: DUF4395 domain-containing protein [Bellilinea sp.]
MSIKPLQPVDHTALRTNQTVIILGLVLAFILNLPALAGLIGALMLFGALLKQPAFGWLYRAVLKPLGVLHPDVIADYREPHSFAQGFGGVVLLAGFMSLVAGAATIGWALTWLVIALAALNLFVGFCVGCAVYYWLNRLNVPGFSQSPPPGSQPGWRPRRQQP